MEEETPAGAPEWVVTYGDMMSLLLTFFIMLVSMSEIKSQERYQALVEAIRRQFGYDSTWKSLMPGNQKPRNSAIAKLATMGRARKFDIMAGGAPDQSAAGDYPKVRTVRPGDRSVVGTTLAFKEDEVTLNDQNQQLLLQATLNMLGKPQVIEIRGHTTFRPAQDFTSYRDNWDLAYERCRSVMQFLTSELGVPPERIRLVVVASGEPLYWGDQPDQLLRNARVEVYLTNDLAVSNPNKPGSGRVPPSPPGVSGNSPVR